MGIQPFNTVIEPNEPQQFVEGMFCPDCGNQMTIEEIQDNRCSECGAPLNL